MSRAIFSSILSRIYGTIKSLLEGRKGGSVTIGGEELDEVEQFTFIGSVINKIGGTDEDINPRICKVRQAFTCVDIECANRKYLDQAP